MSRLGRHGLTWQRWLVGVVGLAVVLGAGTPAAAQSLTALQLDTLASSTTAPATTTWREGAINQFNNYYNVDIETPYLLAITTAQSIRITSTSGSRAAYNFHACPTKSVARVSVSYRETNNCWGLGSGPGTKTITLSQAAINNGGVVVHTVHDTGSSSSIVAHWVPIYSSNTLTLAPAFAASTTSYLATIPTTASILGVTPTGSGTITVSVNGGSGTTVASGTAHPISSLNTGTNTVTISAASGGSTTTYTLTHLYHSITQYHVTSDSYDVQNGRVALQTVCSRLV